jgi:hypothetical protein
MRIVTSPSRGRDRYEAVAFVNDVVVVQDRLAASTALSSAAGVLAVTLLVNQAGSSAG